MNGARLLDLFDWLRHRARVRQLPEQQAWGLRAEDLAHRFLQRKGYRVIGRNWRSRYGLGELDIIARDGQRVVMVEVKSRKDTNWGAPEDAINDLKRRRLLRAAVEYTRQAGLNWEDLRFDAVSVVFSEPEPTIEHLIDILSFRTGR